MHHERLFVSRDPELVQLATRIHRERPDLQAAFPEPQHGPFWQWLGSFGLLEYPELARFFPPLPGEHLRVTVCGGTQLDTHLRTGAEDCAMVLELHELFARRSADSLQAVLDFGCGCGRVLRWFQTALPGAVLHGTDLRRAAIDWCRDHLRGEFVANELQPPLPFADGSFDLVYALSVFSHLNRDQCVAWMRELARVTRPGGTILITTHGAFAAAVCRRSRSHQELLQIDAADAAEIVRTLAKQDFVHRVLPGHVRGALGGVAEDYGQAFFGEPFARQAFAEFTEYLGGVPCALELWQDVHVYRPRPR